MEKTIVGADRRVLLTPAVIEALMEIASGMGAEDLSDREKLGMAVAHLVDIKNDYIATSDVTKERISMLINFGEYPDPSAVLNAAVSALFDQSRQKILQKIEQL